MNIKRLPFLGLMLAALLACVAVPSTSASPLASPVGAVVTDSPALPLVAGIPGDVLATPEAVAGQATENVPSPLSPRTVGGEAIPALLASDRLTAVGVVRGADVVQAHPRALARGVAEVPVSLLELRAVLPALSPALVTSKRDPAPLFARVPGAAPLVSGATGDATEARALSPTPLALVLASAVSARERHSASDSISHVFASVIENEGTHGLRLGCALLPVIENEKGIVILTSA